MRACACMCVRVRACACVCVRVRACACICCVCVHVQKKINIGYAWLCSCRFDSAFVIILPVILFESFKLLLCPYILKRFTKNNVVFLPYTFLCNEMAASVSIYYIITKKKIKILILMCFCNINVCN